MNSTVAFVPGALPVATLGAVSLCTPTATICVSAAGPARVEVPSSRSTASWAVSSRASSVFGSSLATGRTFQFNARTAVDIPLISVSEAIAPKTLDDWYYNADKNIVSGKSLNHPNFADGTILETSPIKTVKGVLVVTESGSTYTLGKVNEIFLLSLGEYDPTSPLKSFFP